jgi:hypothetical protein
MSNPFFGPFFVEKMASKVLTNITIWRQFSSPSSNICFPSFDIPPKSHREFSISCIFSKCINYLINRSSRRKRGMASNPLFIIHTRLFFAFSQWTLLIMANLGLKEMGKFLWKGREKSLFSWLSQFSFAKRHFKNEKEAFLYVCLNAIGLLTLKKHY